ncbi:MAG UNVERIFIED_CONTAM: hypothetical protein LVR29_19290 [Microcystis novacekii LVE1205-3]
MLTVLFSVVLPKALTPSPILTPVLVQDSIQVTRTGFGGLTALPSLGALTGDNSCLVRELLECLLQLKDSSITPLTVVYGLTLDGYWWPASVQFATLSNLAVLSLNTNIVVILIYPCPSPALGWAVVDFWGKLSHQK